MSKLTKLIKETVGSGTFESGRGMTWFYCGKEVDGKRVTRRGYKDSLEVINKCKERFDHYLMKRKFKSSYNEEMIEIVNHHFIAKDKKNNFVGVLTMKDLKDDEDCIVIIDYMDQFDNEEEFHTYNKNYKDVVCYQKQN